MYKRNFSFARFKKYVIIIAYLLILFLIFTKDLPIYYLPLSYVVLTAMFIIIYYQYFLGCFGNCYYTLGKNEKAKMLYEKAIKRNSKGPTVYLNYGVMLVKEGRAKDAIKYLKIAEELNPNILTYKNIMLSIGSCYWIMGDLDSSIEVLEAIIKKFSKVNSSVYVTLGYVYFLKGDMTLAVKYTNEAIKDSPQSGSAWDNLGQINYKKGNVDDAKEDFKKSIGYKNDFADSYYYLGIIFEEEESFHKAKECFDAANLCNINVLNTVTKEQISEKCKKYL